MKIHQIFQPSLLERKPIVLKVNKKLIVLVFKYLTFNKTIFRLGLNRKITRTFLLQLKKHQLIK